MADIQGEPLRMPAEYWAKMEANGAIPLPAIAEDDPVASFVGEADPAGPWEPPFITFEEFLAERAGQQL